MHLLVSNSRELIMVVAVPARGAGCIGVVRKKNNFITLLPSPWEARAASTAIPQYLPKGTEVAVPVGGGVDCIL